MNIITVKQIDPQLEMCKHYYWCGFMSSLFIIGLLVAIRGTLM